MTRRFWLATFLPASLVLEARFKSCLDELAGYAYRTRVKTDRNPNAWR